MNIGIDANEANVDNLVGVSVYTLSLLKEFQKKSCKDLIFSVYLRKKPKKHLPEQTRFFKYKIVKGSILWSRFFLPLQLAKEKFSSKLDMFFSPAHYSPKYSFTPLVVAIHDLSYFYFPKEFLKKDLYKLKNWTKESIQKAEKIIAVSKTTKNDILRFYQIPENKIKVVYNGFAPPPAPKRKKLPFNLKPKSYFLFVSTIQPRKNIKNLLIAFEIFKKKTKSDLKLVIAGKKGWLWQPIMEVFEKIKFKDEIVFTDYLEEETKNLLFSQAFAFVHPSFYEGFGLPLLEAFYWRIPVVSSFSSALPEIAEDAAVYFNPKNPEEMADKMLKLYSSPTLRKRLIKKGSSRLKIFSWKKTAEETIQVFYEAIQKNQNLYL